MTYVPGGGGGGGNIATAGDVALNNTANGEVLTFDTSVSKWRNAAAPSGSATQDATATQKGVIQLAGDLGGTAAAPTVSGLSAKANDNAVVHLTGNETVAGVKTFSASPVVPAPAAGTAAVNKDYVDYLTVVTTANTANTLALTNAGKVLETTSASATTVTVPTNASVAFPVGTLVEIYQVGTGQVTVAAATGVNLQSPGGRLKLAEQFSTVSLRKRATDTWVVAGDLVL